MNIKELKISGLKRNEMDKGTCGPHLKLIYIYIYIYIYIIIRTGGADLQWPSFLRFFFLFFSFIFLSFFF